MENLTIKVFMDEDNLIAAFDSVTDAENFVEDCQNRYPDCKFSLEDQEEK